MKRILPILLALCLGLCACAGGESVSPAQTETPAPESTPSPAPASPTPAPFTPLSLGQSVAPEGVELVLERAETTGAVTAVRDGMGVSRNAPEDKLYLAVTGRIRNTGTQELDAGNIAGSVVMDGEYVYDLETYVIQDMAFKSALPPLMEARLVLYALIPRELAGSFRTCEVRFGFLDGFAVMPASAESCPNAYALELSADDQGENRVLRRDLVPREYALEETIATDFAEMTFTSVKVSNRLARKYRGNNYSISTDTACRVLYMEGMIKNTGGRSVVPCFSGTVTVNGYTYPLRDWEAVKGMWLAPLQEAPVYLYAEVPPALLKTHFACEFLFGVNPEVANNEYTCLEGCEYAYSLQWER